MRYYAFCIFYDFGKIIRKKWNKNGFNSFRRYTFDVLGATYLPYYKPLPNVKEKHLGPDIFSN